MIILGNGVGARVEAAALQGSHRRGIESTIEVETDRMATMPGGIGCARKVQAEGETTTTTEAETERRTGERGGDRPETIFTTHHLPGLKGPGAMRYLSWATRPPAATSVNISSAPGRLPWSAPCIVCYNSSEDFKFEVL